MKYVVVVVVVLVVAAVAVVFHIVWGHLRDICER